MVKGIGSDIVSVERVRRLDAGVLRRILTEKEQKYCAGYNPPHERVAGRFAAKEAVMKALGTGWATGVGFTQIEILPDAAGAPQVQLTGRALEVLANLGATRCLVTIAHEREYAVAFALLE